MPGLRAGDPVKQVVSFNKPIPNANLDPATRMINVKLTASITGCSNKGVTGGAGAISGGTLTMQGKLDVDATCGDLAFGRPDITFLPNKMQATWTTTTALGKHPNVGKSKTAGRRSPSHPDRRPSSHASVAARSSPVRRLRAG